VDAPGQLPSLPPPLNPALVFSVRICTCAALSRPFPQHDISIGSPVFAGLTGVPSRHTRHTDQGTCDVCMQYIG